MAAPLIVSTWSFGLRGNTVAWPALEAGGASLDAVELVYLNGSKFRVGTDEPRVLAQALEAEIARRGWEES